MIAKEHHALSSIDLAFERTMLPYERTLMAWIRTAVSLISFGFTIYYFLGEIKMTSGDHEQLFSPGIVGMIMILFGLLSLFLAQMQHLIAMKKTKAGLSWCSEINFFCAQHFSFGFWTCAFFRSFFPAIRSITMVHPL